MQELGMKTNIPRLVNTVDVPEGCGNAEVGADLSECHHSISLSIIIHLTETDLNKCFVNIEYIFGLGIQLAVIYTSVVNAIFLATSDTDFHLQPEAYSSAVVSKQRGSLPVQCLPRGAIFLKYSTHVLIFSSFDSSLRSSIWLEKRASPC
jgi:hypothetical protein